MVDHICPYCNNKFSSKDYLHNHIDNEKCLKKKICHGCGKSFARKSGLDVHQKGNSCGRAHMPRKRLTLKQDLIIDEKKNPHNLIVLDYESY